MTLIRRDRVVETTTSTGTGDLTLAGAVTGYRSFGGVMAIGNTCYCGVEAIGSNGLPTGDWEIGLYTYSAANTLTRTTIHASSNSGAAVSFAAGTKRVIMGLTVADMANKMDSFAFRGTFTTDNANYSWDFEDGVVPAAFTQTNALTVVDDLDGGVLQKSVTFNGGAAISASFATFQFSFDVVADASHTSVTIRSRIQCNYATGGAWEGLRFYVDGVDQGQIAQSVNAEATYTDHVITGLAAGSHTIIVQFHTSAYADVGFQNVRIASISNGVVAASPYKLGDIVDYGIAGLRYMCMVAGTNALPTDATAWTCLGATYLSSLGDVDFSGGLTNSYVLTYNSASGKWKPGVVPTPTIQSLGGTSIGGATNGQAMAYNSSTGNWENKSLTFAALTDVGVSGVSNNQFLRYNLATTKWVPATMSVSYLSDVDVATTAPTNGQVLVWNAASSKWLPGTVTSGGGTAHPWYWAPPLAADFTTFANVDGTNVTISDDTDTGLFLDCGVTGSTDDIRAALKALPAAGVSWTLIVHLNPLLDSNGAQNGAGIILREAATDKMVFLGALWGSRVDSYRGTMTAYSAGLATGRGTQQPWFYKISYVAGSNSYFTWESMDGKHWNVVNSGFVATTAFTTRADQIGLGFTMNTASKRPLLTCDYWSQTW